jgi:hypothetical protein
VVFIAVSRMRICHELFACGCQEHVFLCCFQCDFVYCIISAPKIISFLCVSGFCRTAFDRTD